MTSYRAAVLLVLAAAVRFRSGLFAVSFDEEFAAVRGLNVADTASVSTCPAPALRFLG